MNDFERGRIPDLSAAKAEREHEEDGNVPEMFGITHNVSEEIKKRVIQMKTQGRSMVSSENTAKMVEAEKSIEPRAIKNYKIQQKALERGIVALFERVQDRKIDATEKTPETLQRYLEFKCGVNFLSDKVSREVSAQALRYDNVNDYISHLNIDYGTAALHDILGNLGVAGEIITTLLTGSQTHSRAA